MELLTKNQTTHPLIHNLFCFILIVLGVYLFLRFILPLCFPIILSYVLMRMLYPLAKYQQNKWHFPGWLSYTTTLTLFFSLVTGILLLIIQQFWHQFHHLIVSFPVYQKQLAHLIKHQADKFCCCSDHFFCMRSGSTLAYVNSQIATLQKDCTHWLTTHTAPFIGSCFSFTVRFSTVLFITGIGMILLCKDMESLNQIYKKSPYYPAVHKVALTLKKTGLAYLKSQGIITLAIWFLCSLGLFFIKNPYSILIGAGIALVDAFPVLGSGTVLVPWAAFYIAKGTYSKAAVLLLLFLVTTFLREFLEARLMGNNMGMLPFTMLASLFVGVSLFGVWGIVLGPFGVILIKAIFRLIVPSPDSTGSQKVPKEHQLNNLD